MPIFEYECKNCGNRFEELVDSTNAEIRCPKCKSPETDKLLSIFSSSGGSGGSSTPSYSRPGCGSGGFT
ncbi:MAG: zinc ribbon domain-containing protein [candidate division Zixibacteria bacterium]|nr:zinc ribbon domain-containing protein [candidate division Zixibacteria bacterium]